MPLLSRYTSRVFAFVYLALILLLTIVINLFSWDEVEAFLEKIPYRCPLKRFTALECAFCGMTHSWLSLMRGDFASSIQFNVFGPFLFVGSFAIAVQYARGRTIALLSKREFGWTILSLLGIYAVARNLMH